MRRLQSPTSKSRPLRTKRGRNLIRQIWQVTMQAIMMMPAMMMLGLLAFESGCSQARKSAEDVDWGQPQPSVARRPTMREPRSPPAVGRDRPAGPVGDGKDVHASQAAGDGAKPSGDEAGRRPEQSEPPAPPNEAGNEPGAGGDGPGGPSDSPPEAERQRPAPALPGREPAKPALSAAEAAESAKALLKRAQQLLRTADPASAAAVAIEAYEQVLPHAESHAECKRLCGQLEGLLTAAGRRQGRAEAVPTRFE
jgi:hypothetical protein